MGYDQLICVVYTDRHGRVVFKHLNSGNIYDDTPAEIWPVRENRSDWWMCFGLASSWKWGWECPLFWCGFSERAREKLGNGVWKISASGKVV